MSYVYNGQFNLDKLTQEIADSTITIALDYLNYFNEELTVFFKATLSTAEETTLSTIIAAHDPTFVDTISEVSLAIPKDSAGRPIFTGSPFSDTGGFRFRGASFSGICAANSTTDIDYLISQERWINGGLAVVNNIGENDQITFQVVDRDNVFGFGAGVVLDEFISNFYIPTDGKLEVALAYPARIVAGLYLRLKYTSTHSSGCTLKCNLYLHWKAV